MDRITSNHSKLLLRLKCNACMPLRILIKIRCAIKVMKRNTCAKNRRQRWLVEKLGGTLGSSNLWRKDNADTADALSETRGSGALCTVSDETRRRMHEKTGRHSITRLQVKPLSAGYDGNESRLLTVTDCAVSFRQSLTASATTWPRARTRDNDARSQSIEMPRLATHALPAAPSTKPQRRVLITPPTTTRSPPCATLSTWTAAAAAFDLDDVTQFYITTSMPRRTHTPTHRMSWIDKATQWRQQPRHSTDKIRRKAYATISSIRQCMLKIHALIYPKIAKAMVTWVKRSNKNICETDFLPFHI